MPETDYLGQNRLQEQSILFNDSYIKKGIKSAGKTNSKTKWKA